MHKTYMALVAGSWQLGTKRIDAPLATDNRQHGERHVKVAAAGKDSVSIFKPVQFLGSLATLMQVDIPTGRTHQIRVHASFAGHPLLGDDKYGDRERNAELKQHGLKRTFLHAQVHRLRLARHRRAVPHEYTPAAGSVRSPGCDHADEAQIGKARRCGPAGSAA